MFERIFKKAEEISKVINVSDSKFEELRHNLGLTFKAPQLTKDLAASMIDHTNLSFHATDSDIEKVCMAAYKYNFTAVCVNPFWVKYADEIRKDFNASYKIASVIDFPLGASTLESRVKEAEQALKDGADEIDLVISLGLIRSNRISDAYNLIKSVVDTGGYQKIILEMSELDAEEKITAALLAFFAGAHMLKTSTGINGKATEPDVKLLRAIAGNTLGVKAAGGIRYKVSFFSMVSAGADRIGCSSSVKIMESWDD